MLALTETAPWGTAIIHHGKYIENRVWAPSPDLIGKRFAIHQGKTLDEDALVTVQMLCVEFPPACELPMGALVGTVKLQGYVWIDGKQIEWRGCDPLPDAALDRIMRSQWRNPDATHLWCLNDPRALRTPIPCRGLQKLWRVPQEHIAALEACR